MAPLRQYAVLGPLQSGAETRAFLGCEVIDGAPHPDLPVVVVWLPDQVTSDPKQVARLQRETAFVTQLRHKNIIRIHGLECFEEGWARIVAFVDGEPLSLILSRAKAEGKPLDPLLAARIMTEVCEGVHHAHEEGQARYAGRPIVHGGIRPDTLLVTFQGVTMVTGYGASVLAPPQQSANPERYAYLAPEQIIGGKSTASPATDVYAMGALLHELLTGEAPFVRSPDIERAILTGEPPAIDGEGVLGRLGNIATAALSKRGTDRFESAAAMREAILSALGEDPLSTQEDVATFVCGLIPEGSPERVGRKDLLRGAVDPDSVTILSRPGRVEGSARAIPGANDLAADPSSDGAGATRRVAKPRSDETVVDGRPPVQVSIQSPRGDDEHPVPLPRDEVTIIEKPDQRSAFEAAPLRSSNGPGASSDELPLVIPAAQHDESVTEADTNPFSVAAIEGKLEHARPAAAQAGAWLDTEPTGQMAAIAAQAATQQPLVQSVAGAAGGASYASQRMTPALAGAGPHGGSVVPGEAAGGAGSQGASSGAPNAMSSPQVGANAMSAGTGMQASPHLGMYASQSQSPSPYRMSGPPGGAPPAGPPGGGSGSDDLGRAPRRPLERSESVITAFDRKVGDSSRSVLIAILAAAAILLAGVFYFASPPPEVVLEEQGEVRHALPKELVKAALTKPKERDPNETEEPSPSEASTPTSGAGAMPAGEGGEAQAAGGEVGRINLKSDPEVDVYDGTEYLGRTPLTAKLPAGNRKLRFTDKKTGLNIYRTYKIPAGGERRAEESFGTSELIVEAPEGSSILLNSRFIGKAPLEPVRIYEGKYHLKVTHDGKTWADWFDAPPGKKINYRVNLHD